MDWDHYRNYFPVTQNKIYLNHAAVSPLNLRALQAIRQFQDERSTGNIEFWPDILEHKKALAERIGQLVHAAPEQIAITTNTSHGLNILARGLDWKSGDRILLNNFEFPANVYPFLNLQREGVKIDFVQHRDGRIAIEDIVANIRPKTRLLSVSFVEFLNGFKNDLQAIGSICRDKGIVFCVDGIQGLGALELDVGACQIDFLSSGGHKWLMWPLGTAFIYVSPRIFDEVYPVFAGWLSVKDSWDFFNYRLDFLPTAERFEGATYNANGIVGARATLEMFLEIGMENIEGKILQLTDRLINQLQQLGIRIYSSLDTRHRSGIVSFYHPRADRLFQFFRENGVYVSLREGLIRVAPHFYNSLQEIDRLVELLKSFDASK